MRPGRIEDEVKKKTFSNINNNFLIDVTSLFFPYFVSFFVAVVAVVAVAVVDGGVVVTAAAAIPIPHRVARVIAIPFAIVYCLIAHTNSKALAERGMCERARVSRYTAHRKRDARGNGKIYISFGVVLAATRNRVSCLNL